MQEDPVSKKQLFRCKAQEHGFAPTHPAVIPPLTGWQVKTGVFLLRFSGMKLRFFTGILKFCQFLTI
jgi:hypothetical protein